MKFRAKRVEQFNCGACGFRIRAPDAAPMSTMRCPGCGKGVRVPAVFDHFLLTQAIKIGSTGTVFKAFDEKLHRMVALKILRDESAEDHKFVEQTIQVSRALASVDHPNIARIYAIDRFNDQDYLVLELVAGGNVGQLVDPKRFCREGAVLDLGARIAEGLQAALAAGIVHMNLKPANILLTPSRQPKLIEFSPANFQPPGASIVGTPYFLAPEVARGKKPDMRSDMYSLGVTLFYILAKRLPFRGEDAVRKKLARPAPSILQFRPDLHPETARVIAKLLRRDPENRYSNYRRLIDQLREAQASAEGDPAIEPTPAFPAASSSSVVEDDLAQLAHANLSPDATHIGPAGYHGPDESAIAHALEDLAAGEPEPMPQTLPERKKQPRVVRPAAKRTTPAPSPKLPRKPADDEELFPEVEDDPLKALEQVEEVRPITRSKRPRSGPDFSKPVSEPPVFRRHILPPRVGSIEEANQNVSAFFDGVVDAVPVDDREAAEQIRSARLVMPNAPEIEGSVDEAAQNVSAILENVGSSGGHSPDSPTDVLWQLEDPSQAQNMVLEAGIQQDLLRIEEHLGNEAGSTTRASTNAASPFAEEGDGDPSASTQETRLAPSAGSTRRQSPVNPQPVTTPPPPPKTPAAGKTGDLINLRDFQEFKDGRQPPGSR